MHAVTANGIFGRMVGPSSRPFSGIWGPTRAKCVKLRPINPGMQELAARLVIRYAKEFRIATKWPIRRLLTTVCVYKLYLLT